jgi:hypothetical protein
MLLQIPPVPRNLQKDVTKEEYIEIYKNMVQKYNRRNRMGKKITTDPLEIISLSDKGYKIKAERYKHKREHKRIIKK